MFLVLTAGRYVEMGQVQTTRSFNASEYFSWCSAYRHGVAKYRSARRTFIDSSLSVVIRLDTLRSM